MRDALRQSSLCSISIVDRSKYLSRCGGRDDGGKRKGSTPICAAADPWLVTLIEEHGEAQDVAPETLAQAFFTVVEARKACNLGQVEAALKIYEGIRLDAATSHGE